MTAESWVILVDTSSHNCAAADVSMLQVNRRTAGPAVHPAQGSADDPPAIAVPLVAELHPDLLRHAYLHTAGTSSGQYHAPTPVYTALRATASSMHRQSSQAWSALCP